MQAQVITSIVKELKGVRCVADVCVLVQEGDVGVAVTVQVSWGSSVGRNQDHIDRVVRGQPTAASSLIG